MITGPSAIARSNAVDAIKKAKRIQRVRHGPAAGLPHARRVSYGCHRALEGASSESRKSANINVSRALSMVHLTRFACQCGAWASAWEMLVTSSALRLSTR